MRIYALGHFRGAGLLFKALLFFVRALKPLLDPLDLGFHIDFRYTLIHAIHFRERDGFDQLSWV